MTCSILLDFDESLATSPKLTRPPAKLFKMSAEGDSHKPISTLDHHAGKVIPFFVSSDIQRSHDFYTKTLGMHGSLSSTTPDPTDPNFLSVFVGHKAAVNIYVVKTAQETVWPKGNCMIMMKSPEALDTFRKEMKLKGVEEVKTEGGPASGTNQPAMGPVGNPPWGYRQFDFWDHDRNLMVFFAILEEE